MNIDFLESPARKYALIIIIVLVVLIIFAMLNHYLDWGFSVHDTITGNTTK